MCSSSVNDEWCVSNGVNKKLETVFKSNANDEVFLMEEFQMSRHE